MDEHTAMKAYDALWKEYRAACGTLGYKASRRGTAQIDFGAANGGRSREELVLAMAEHCRACLVLYDVSLPGCKKDPYRQAMWIRRLYLHEHGRTAEVWDGTDALLWLRAQEAGKVGVPIAALGQAS